MFKKIITSTPFTGDIANECFCKIQAGYYENDVSFVSTLRALVYPRMKDEEYLIVTFNQSIMTARQLGSYSCKTAVDTICADTAMNGDEIHIHSFIGEQEDSYAWMELINSHFAKIYQGWIKLDKITDFFIKQFYVLCFINPELKSVMIFVDNLDIRKLHYLQCSIFAFLPWYFNPEEGVSEEEMALISSLREKTSIKYETMLNKMSQKYDFRTLNIKSKLAGFESKFERIELDRIKGFIENANREISRLNEQIGSHFRNINDAEIKLLGLEEKIRKKSENSEIMDYFLCNDKLVLIDVNGETLRFGVKSYLTYFDEDMVSSALRNSSSYIYDSDAISGDEIQKLMKAIFIDRVLKIRSCAAYDFNLRGNIHPICEFSFGIEFQDYLPNTHIDRYGCMGNYLTIINKLLGEKNYIGAIEQCIASSKSLNFGDSTVMEAFMSAIYGTSRRYKGNFIELPDGTTVNPKEAIKWIKEREAESNEQGN